MDVGANPKTGKRRRAKVLGVRILSLSTMTVEDWIAEARSEADPILYTEPVGDWTVHVDGGHLAFVRADAVLYVDSRAERHNIDYFTLIKQDGIGSSSRFRT